MTEKVRAAPVDHQAAAGPVVLDELDRSVLELLRADARMSVRAIARELNRSPGAVGERIARLEAAEVITGYHAQVDLARLGYMHTLVVVRTNDDQHSDSCAEALSHLDEVHTVWVVTGSWDLVVECYVRDAFHLRELLQGTLRGVEGVVHTEAMIVLDSVGAAGRPEDELDRPVG
ncbi:Lrp/AsnC family transcriptional regulator [Saccharopolyspora sp. NPDC047091]|uniref:Lrp/AsnC family transcriptional regulator n=1 Tax=Saccharopolyspora sp. NPDC047091 TaxID=3155924 RepID=UPI0033C23AA5